MRILPSVCQTKHKDLLLIQMKVNPSDVGEDNPNHIKYRSKVTHHFKKSCLLLISFVLVLVLG